MDVTRVIGPDATLSPRLTENRKGKNNRLNGARQDLPRNLGVILSPSSNGFRGLWVADEFKLGGGVGRFDNGRYVKYPSYSSSSLYEVCARFLSRRSMTTAMVSPDHKLCFCSFPGLSPVYPVLGP